MNGHDRCAVQRPAYDAASLNLRRAPLRSLIGVLVAAGTILGVLIGFARADTGTVHRIDVTTAVRLNEYVARHPAEVTFWKVVTNIGGPLTWRILAGVAAVALWWRRRRRDAVIIAVAMITAALASGLLKALVDRHRPVVPDPVDHVGGASFPSGHALTSFIALGLVVLLLWQVISLAQ